VTGHTIIRNDVVVMRSSGGGGYGDPLTRDPRRVAEDVAREVVSMQAARDWYGVVIAPGGGIDEAATSALRPKLTQARSVMRIIADDALDPYVGLKGRHRIVQLAAADAAHLGVADDGLVEMFGRHPAPLRAWVRVAGSEHRTVRMDAFGRNVLGVGNLDQIYMRRVDTPIVPKGLAGITR
jgi:N-methylhydantoinase B